jgi:hypothetical protein
MGRVGKDGWRGDTQVKSMFKTGKNIRSTYWSMLVHEKSEVGRPTICEQGCRWRSGLQVRDGENYESGKSVNTINIPYRNPYIESKR